MARPPKDPHLRMNEEIRIPLTADQKAAIKEAADNAGLDMAEWIRPILFRAAKYGPVKTNVKKTER